jgi:hypothetical protein
LKFKESLGKGWTNNASKYEDITQMNSKSSQKEKKQMNSKYRYIVAGQRMESPQFAGTACVSVGLVMRMHVMRWAQRWQA